MKGGHSIEFKASHTIVLTPVSWQSDKFLERGYDFQVIKRSDIPSDWKISDNRTIAYLEMRIDNCLRGCDYKTALRLSLIAAGVRIFNIYDKHC